MCVVTITVEERSNLASKQKQRRLAQAEGTVAVLDPVAEAPAEAPAKPGLIEGLIVDGSRGIYRVETAEGPFSCTIRGRLRKQLVYAESSNTSARKTVQRVKTQRHDPVAVGDKVRVLPTGGGGGVIEEVVERAGGSFTRGDPDKGQGKLTAIAGLDQLVATFAAQEPTPHLRVLDRLLVLAESQDLPVAICLTKIDLGIEDWLAERLRLYHRIGYPVLLASAVTGDGLDALREQLAGKTSALFGPSGVGKSSLLNKMQPGLGQKVSAISTLTHKGRHTTVGTRLFPLDHPAGGYIADTAGFRSLALDGRTLEALDWCFREFRPFLEECRMNDCSHLHEPHCGVRDAVQRGAIDLDRYNSYRRLLEAGDESFDIDIESEEED
jgi:ribosome biogenesis GTPase / thiamine phosphate phosphatase